jgi:predicted RNA-binding protein with TRAM domain
MEKGRTLIKLLGIMFLGIIVLGCTPKKTANAVANTTVTEERTAEIISDAYFSVEYSNNPYADVMPFIIDDGGWFMLFRTIKPYKDLRFISIGFDDDFNFYEENVFTTIPDDLGKFVFQAYASEGIPNSGISLTDENGNRKYFYITLSGIDGSASLSEFQNTPPVVDGGDFTVEIMDVRGLGLELENAIKITAYNGSQQDVTIPSQIQGLPVTHIGEMAFGVKNLTSVIIPDSVISIGNGAFANNQLTSIIIPDSVIAIGYSAFYENQLTSVIIPDSLAEIGVEAFYGNRLTSVNIPNSGISLTDENGNSKYFYITLSGIDGSASLSEFQNTPPTVDGGDFTVEIMDVRGLGLELENGIKITAYIGNKQEVIIPSQIQGLYVTHIGESAFMGKNLTSVIIPNSVISIGYIAFYNNKLTSVVIPDSVISIGLRVFESNQLTSVIIGNSVTSIGGSAFANNKLTSVTIPESVTEIGRQAFAGNPLNGNVTIPDGIDIEIGYNAFGNVFDDS